MSLIVINLDMSMLISVYEVSMKVSMYGVRTTHLVATESLTTRDMYYQLRLESPDSASRNLLSASYLKLKITHVSSRASLVGAGEKLSERHACPGPLMIGKEAEMTRNSNLSLVIRMHRLFQIVPKSFDFLER